MKIVAVETCPSKQRGGSEKAFYEVLISLKKIGHEITLAYCEFGDLIPDYEEFGIQTFKIKSTNIQDWLSFKTYFAFKKSIYKIAAVEPDLVYINYLSDTPLAAMLWIFHKIPSICHIRVPYMGSSKQFSISAKFIKGFIVLNQKMKTQYEQNEGLQNVNVINDSIIIPKRKFDVNKNNSAIYLGRISPEKGIKELLQVWQILRDKYAIHYPLDIIGPSFSHEERSYAVEIEDIIKRFDLNNVKLLPPVNNPIETLSLYNFAVMPSLWDEPFGRIMPEAILSNTPIFVRNVGIAEDILSPQKNELIFNSNEDLAERIFLFLKGDLKINIESLQKHIIEHYSIEKNVHLIEQLMFKIIN